MIHIEQIETEEDFKTINVDEIVNFLYTHLGKYKDDKVSIRECINYVSTPNDCKGGFILKAISDKKLVGVLISAHTGMDYFIPKNILVYVAVDSKYRGRGIGEALVNRAIVKSNGSIKLHVEYDNPAIRLYEKLGFSTKYADMRYTKNIK